MDIEHRKVKIRDLVVGYKNNLEDGVTAYDGKLDIRPAFQREFVYSDDARDQVIYTVEKNFPLNLMYWNTKDDGSYEMLDGQQRTMSICEFYAERFAINDEFFTGYFTQEEGDDFLDYELDVYICKGNARQKTDWFKVINIRGQALSEQEFLNALYACPWTSDARRYFSKTGCPAYSIGRDFMSGVAIQQDYLETVLKWKSEGNVKGYMAEQYSKKTNDAKELWDYFEKVIEWAKEVFVEDESDSRTEMKSVSWGDLHRKYGKMKLNGKNIRARVNELMADDDVKKKSGIYEYVLSKDEKHLTFRAFRNDDKRSAYEAQGRKCAIKKCGKKRKITEMEADHIKPWSKGGKTIRDNLQMICVDCNRVKGPM